MKTIVFSVSLLELSNFVYNGAFDIERLYSERLKAHQFTWFKVNLCIARH